MASRHRQILEYHPTIGHLYVPGLTVRMMHENHGYWLTTNQAGFRSDREYSRDKPVGVRRIALFGDSFTAGDGVQNRDRFSEVVARRFPGFEVMNFGLTHSGTDQQYLIFQERQFDPDIIVLCPMVENIRRNLRASLPNRTHDGRLFERRKPYFTVVGGNLMLHNVPVPHPKLEDERKVPVMTSDSGVRTIWRHASRLKMRVRRAAIDLRLASRVDLFPEYADAGGPAWVLMRTIIEHWARQFGKPFVVAPIPWYLHYEQPDRYDVHAYRSRFHELNGPGIRVCDCLPDLLRHTLAERRRFTYERDKHFTVEGHAAFGNALADALGKVI